MPTTRRRHHAADERGAAIVEFALLAPLLFALIFGVFSGGIAYNRKLAITNGVREGSRYGATLAVAQARAQTTTCPTATTDIDCWLAQVAKVTQMAAEGNLDSSGTVWEVCVAYVHPAGGTTLNDSNRKLPLSPSNNTPLAGTCFTDGRPDTERRVQVTAQRNGKLEYLVSSTSLTLRSRSVTRFEAIP